MKALYLLILPLILTFSTAADAGRGPHHKYHHHGSHIGIVFSSSHHNKVSISGRFVISSGNSRAVIGIGNDYHRPYYKHRYHRYNRYYRSYHRPNQIRVVSGYSNYHYR